MPQTYQSINTGAGGDTVKTGIIRLAERTDTLRSNFSGTSHPTGGVVGQHSYRTDLGAEYVLISTGPDVWSKVLTGTLAIADGGTGATTASAARTALGLGSAAVLNNGTASGELPTVSQADARYTQRANNLSDLNSAATARTNLGLGALATLATVGSAQIDDGAISTTAKLGNGIVTYAKMQVASAVSKLIGSPSTGTTLQEITLGSGLSMSGGTLSVSGAASEIAARRTADVSATTSYVDLPDLTVSIGASEVWSSEFYLQVSTNAALTISITFDAPTTPTSFLVMGAMQTSSGTTDTSVIVSTGSTMQFSLPNSQLTILKLSIIVENSTNAGTLSLNFKGSSGTTTIKKNSYMVARKH